MVSHSKLSAVKKGSVTAYCVSCRRKVTMKNPKKVKIQRNGRTTYMLKGTHTIGGKVHKLSRIISKEDYDKF